MMMFLLVVSLIGCGSAQPSTDPDALSETGHRERAEAERRLADSHERQYDSTLIRTSGSGGDHHEGLAGGDYPNLVQASEPGPIQDPGSHHLDAARRRRELARQHEAAAETLVSFESEQCGAIPPDVRVECPFLTTVQSTAPLEDGVALTLIEGVDEREVLARARCHAAFGRRRGREGMGSCPLYVEGVHVGLSEGRIILTTPIGSAVSEVRERAAAHAAEP